VGKVNIAGLRDGMILAENLVDTTGRCLLAQGSVIQDRHIHIMKSWGITEADVEGISHEQAVSSAMVEIDPELVKKCADYMEPFFRHSNKEHEVMQEIRRLSILRLARDRSGPPGIREFCPDLENIDTRETLPDEEIVPLLRLVINCRLASFPDIYYRIDKVLKDPMSSVSHLADTISTDPSLSATLLRLANSAFYALPSKTESVIRAVTLIGTKEISTLAMGILATRFFRDIPQNLINMKNFWAHSVACGLFASILAQHKIGFSEEKFFIAGLLHDIGRLIMAMGLPKNMAYAVGQSRRRSIPLNEIEEEVFGFNHTKVAALLMQKWEFPITLENMVRFHHDPAGSPNPLESSIIHVADIMAIAFQFGHSGEVIVPPLNAKAWEALAISQSVIEPTLAQTERLVNETVRDFLYE
jgi:putative nucleotidyltransferase with HDIG domain